ncbi:M23 family metallopeptidase, partial [Nocardioides szechwanensis]|uniref:M23 family metallopeptidase n=1 Tax=Nocardioides szechwanensis TaxID=1005944 RepID=UPI001C3FBF2D
GRPVRFFPSASRRRTAVASLALAAALGGSVVPLANATVDDDHLRDRQDNVEQQIERAHDELGETSKRVQRATAALESARSQLLAAKADLADVRTRLAAARARDREMQAKLLEAQAALAQARQDVLDGQAALAVQREEVVDTVNSIYAAGDPQLLAFASLLDADSPEDLVRRRGATDAIVASEDRAYSGLQEAEILLRVREIEVEDAKEEMETRRADAAENLAMVRDLLEEARVARANVITRLQTTREARQVALSARAHDKQVLRTLKKREERIKRAIIAAAARAAARAARNGRQGYQGSTGGIFAMPVNGYVTSPFGYRVHPIYGYYGLHDGTDFGVGCGQSLFAVAGGTVSNTYYSSVYGNRLYLNVGQYNGKNITVVYNHAAGYRVAEGERVARGEVVGYAGSTGWSTGCHLHFTLLVNGEPVDPMRYM